MSRILYIHNVRIPTPRAGRNTPSLPKYNALNVYHSLEGAFIHSHREHMYTSATPTTLSPRSPIQNECLCWISFIWNISAFLALLFVSYHIPFVQDPISGTYCHLFLNLNQTYERMYMPAWFVPHSVFNSISSIIMKGIFIHLFLLTLHWILTLCSSSLWWHFATSAVSASGGCFCWWVGLCCWLSRYTYRMIYNAFTLCSNSHRLGSPQASI